jgi:hypothetical protein
MTDDLSGILLFLLENPDNLLAAEGDDGGLEALA